jgi:hypothetical protein
MSSIVFGHAITANFCIGISVVLVSMHQFFSEAERGKQRLAAKISTQQQLPIHASPSMEPFVHVPAGVAAASAGQHSNSKRLARGHGHPQSQQHDATASL